jgi:hypothetical protein
MNGPTLTQKAYPEADTLFPLDLSIRLNRFVS